MEFGSKNCFEYQMSNLRALGITLTSDGQLRLSKVVILLGSMMLLMSFELTYAAWQNKDSLEKLSGCLAPDMTCSLTLIKLLTLIWSRSSFTKLVQQLYSITESANDKEFAVIMDENKKDTRISKFYTSSCYTSSTFGIIAPLIFIVAHYSKTGEFVHILPFEGNVFLDISNFRNFCIVYTYQSLSIYAVNFSLLSVDTLFSWYIHNVVAHFRVIQEKLKVIYMSQYDDPIELEMAIRSAIIHHQKVLEMAKALDEVYKPITFAQFSFSSLQLCLIAFQLVHGVAGAQVPFLIAFLMVIYIQMLIYCIGGQRLETESLKIGTKFYEAIRWTHAGKKYRQMLILPILRAQKACTITAVFFEIKMALFVEIVKTAGSYVTLMKSLEEGS